MHSLDLFAERKTLFVEVVLPLSIAKTYTYRVPFEWNEKIQVGVRVIVQFGKNKVYSAIVKTVSTEAPQKYEAKYIMDVVDDDPIVDQGQLALWGWMSD